jgi:predicted DNA binding protein
VIVADLHLDTPLLATTLTAMPAVVVSVDQIDATATDAVRLQCRVPTDTVDSLDSFEAALAEDETVDSLAMLTEGPDVARYRISLSPAGCRHSAYAAWVALDAMLLAAEGTAAGWEFTLSFPSREALCTFGEHCADNDLGMTLDRLRSHDPMTSTNHLGLTDPQHDILVEAIELGYFDIPRSVSLAELGASLGITGQAASERLRRALKSLLESSLSNHSAAADQVIEERA